jgi:regulator of CtrA degradation
MGHPLSINHRIVESLYCEALVLSDEVRHAFALHGAAGDDGVGPALRAREVQCEHVRAAMSGEGLRTTTQMMHAVAWLLNHRAHFMGELSAFQLKRYGRLSPDVRTPDPARLALLPADIQDLVGNTTRFYDRLLRLDRTWRRPQDTAPSALATLRERLERRLVG